MDRSRDELLSLLAFVAGYAVDAIRHKNERTDSGRLAHGDQLARAVSLDMSAWYTPTADGYFSRLSRSQILSAIDEVKGGHGPAIDKLKKAELAARAEQAVAGTGWLPEALRLKKTSASAADAHDFVEAAE